MEFDRYLRLTYLWKNHVFLNILAPVTAEKVHYLKNHSFFDLAVWQGCSLDQSAQKWCSDFRYLSWFKNYEVNNRSRSATNALLTSLNLNGNRYQKSLHQISRGPSKEHYCQFLRLTDKWYSNETTNTGANFARAILDKRRITKFSLSAIVVHE